MKRGFLHEGVVVAEEAAPLIEDIEFNPVQLEQYLMDERGAAESRVDQLRITVDATDEYRHPAQYFPKKLDGPMIALSPYSLPSVGDVVVSKAGEATQHNIVVHELEHFIQDGIMSYRLEKVANIWAMRAYTVSILTAGFAVGNLVRRVVPGHGAFGVIAGATAGLNTAARTEMLVGGHLRNYMSFGTRRERHAYAAQYEMAPLLPEDALQIWFKDDHKTRIRNHRDEQEAEAVSAASVVNTVIARQ